MGETADVVAPSNTAKYLSEFVGTYLLVLTVGCNVISGSPIWAGTSIACVLMVAIYALAGVSGANFNPAVSVALGLSNELDWNTVAVYCAVQLVAGLLAALTYGGLFMQVFNLAPSAGFGWWEAMLAEVLYTCLLCFVVLNVACAKKNAGNTFYGLAIGFVIIAGAYGAGAISGGCFNPAVALGIDASSAGLGFGWGFVYTLFELAGAALASVLFRVVRPDNFDKALVGKDYTLGVKLASEFIGTFFLVLTVGLNVLASSPAPVWSIAASLLCVIYALGNCSGAHFNPAVTLAIFLGGRDQIPGKEAAAYVGAQLLGGIFAACTYTSMHRGRTFALMPGKGYGFGAAGVAEIFATFVLCFVVLSVATIKDPLSQSFGLAIASCVTAGGFAIGAVSGGSLNPAVSVGIAFAHLFNGGLFYTALIYTVYECIGAALASAVFLVVRPDEYGKSITTSTFA